MVEFDAQGLSLFFALLLYPKRFGCFSTVRAEKYLADLTLTRHSLLMGERKLTDVFLSIIIPCRNRPVQLAELLAVIDDQSDRIAQCVEVIVIDDGSAPEIHLAGPFQCISPILIRQARSGGAQSARRAGLRCASGKILHLHDSDDLVGPNWLQSVISSFERDAALDLLITSREVRPERDASGLLIHPQIVQKLQHKLDKFRHYQRLQNAIGPLGGVSFRATVVRETDFLDAPASQDWLLYDAILTRVARVEVTRDVHFVFRTSGKDRISGSPLRRVKGFVYASKVRFATRAVRRRGAIMYCAVAGTAIRNVVKVRNPWFWRAMCRWLARSRTLSRLAGF